MKRLLLYVVGSIVALGVVIHLPPVMHWLAAHGHHGAGVCPLGYGSQGQVAATTRGEHRRVYGLDLGRATAGDVIRWGLGHGVLCTTTHHGAEMECTDRDRQATQWFALDAGGTVRSMRGVRHGDAANVSHEFTARSEQLAIENGGPVATSGSADPLDLEKGALRQAMVEYRAPNYRALLRATNLGDRFVLTEQYRLVN